MKIKELNIKLIITNEQDLNKFLQACLNSGFGEVGKIEMFLNREYNKDNIFWYVEDGMVEYDRIENSHNFTTSKEKLVALDEAIKLINSYKIKKTAYWKEFDINEDGVIDFQSDFYRALYYDEITDILNEIDLKIKAFGGIQYIEPISGNTSVFSSTPYVGYRNGAFSTGFLSCEIDDTLPVYPYKIRFWIEEK